MPCLCLQRCFPVRFDQSTPQHQLKLIEPLLSYAGTGNLQTAITCVCSTIFLCVSIIAHHNNSLYLLHVVLV